MPGELIIEISPNGQEVKADAHGFTGGTCADFINKVVGNLGAVEKKKDKAEMFMRDPNVVYENGVM